MPGSNQVTYERPVAAKLLVQLDNGESWEATPADLRRFDYVKRGDSFGLIYHGLIELLEAAGLYDNERYHELTDMEIAPLFILATTALNRPESAFELGTAGENGAPSVLQKIADIERRLRATPSVQGE